MLTTHKVLILTYLRCDGLPVLLLCLLVRATLRNMADLQALDRAVISAPLPSYDQCGMSGISLLIPLPWRHDGSTTPGDELRRYVLCVGFFCAIAHQGRLMKPRARKFSSAGFKQGLNLLQLVDRWK